ncbi:MAG TPA: energy transducer TonB [Candidatus Polarisedimenticolaceae bacterium]
MSDTTLARPFGVALGLHLGAGSTIALLSWLSLGATPAPPELPLVFRTPPHRVILDGGGRPAPRRAAPRPAPARRELQQPIPTPEPARPEPPGPPVDTDLKGDPTFQGVPGPYDGAGGHGTGPEGPGWGDGPPGDDSGSSHEAPIDVTGTMTPPRLILKVSPEYPRIPLRMGLSGTVLLRAVIGPDGSVEEVALVRATSPLFVEAATDAVRRWRYTPALQSGRPVRVYFDAVVEFKIR